jgi:hypothetical protein
MLWPCFIERNKTKTSCKKQQNKPKKSISHLFVFSQKHANDDRSLLSISNEGGLSLCRLTHSLSLYFRITYIATGNIGVTRYWGVAAYTKKRRRKKLLGKKIEERINDEQHSKWDYCDREKTVFINICMLEIMKTCLQSTHFVIVILEMHLERLTTNFFFFSERHQ